MTVQRIVSVGSAGLLFAGVLVADAAVSGGAVPMCNGLPATIVNSGIAVVVGTDGDDVIVGRPGKEEIIAKGGNDTICSMGGDDVVVAGPGDDWIETAGGNDLADGGPGDDTLLGGPGDDTLLGGPGRDLLDGGWGSDDLSGGSHHDTFHTRDGFFDVIRGDDGGRDQATRDRIDAVLDVARVDPELEVGTRVRYATGFTPFAVGSVNDQDAWCVGPQGAVSSFPTLGPCGPGTDGQIVRDGNDVVLDVFARSGFGEEVGLDFGESTARYLRVEVTATMHASAFFFADVVGPGTHGPDSVFWTGTTYRSNASPGIGSVGTSTGVPFATGIEIDQHSRQITAVKHDGVWRADNDSNAVLDPRQLSRVFFRGAGDGQRLTIDDLVVTDAHSTVLPPAPS